MSTVAITGASGFIGRALTAVLRAGGHNVIALSRQPGSTRFPSGIETRRFDYRETTPNAEALSGADAVVNLSGESIGGRWTRWKKRAIAESRIDGTNYLVASLAQCARRPRVLVSASAVGYYGSRGDTALDEKEGPGRDFLADLCVRWESAASAAEGLGIRTVTPRFGVALGHGGALDAMKLPFLLGIGGPLGSGRQYLSWIHVDDLASLCTFAIENPHLSGPVNAVVPQAVTNAEFSHALGAALRRPSFMPTPAFALRIALGEFAETLLGSERVVPAVAQAAGFKWLHPRLDAALSAIFSSPAAA